MIEILSPTVKYFGQQTIKDIEHSAMGQKPNPILSVKTTDSVETVLSFFKDHGILSAPVKDPKVKKTSNGTPYVGIVDAIDLLTAFAFQPVFNTYDTDNKISELKEDLLRRLQDQQTSILKSPVRDFLGLSLESKRVYAFTEMDAVHKIVDAFSLGIHRALISHKKRPHWSLLTQMDVLRFLKEQSFSEDNPLHDLFCESLSYLRLGAFSKQKLFTLHESRSAISGFRNMMQHQELSALPVVDSEGRLVETLSTSDFHFISLDNFNDVLLPTKNFLAKRRGEFKQTLVTVEMNAALFTVVDKILLTGVHRVWMVDPDFKPVGVISLTDIMKTLSVYAPETQKPEMQKAEIQKPEEHFIKIQKPDIQSLKV